MREEYQKNEDESEDQSPVLKKYKTNWWECTHGSFSSSASEWANGGGFDLTVGNNNPIEIPWGDFKVMKILIDRLNADLYSNFGAKTDE